MSSYLSPFAMWTAFPPSDYYGDSVAIGLAPRRPSRASVAQYVIARFRQPTHLLCELIVRWLNLRRCKFPKRTGLAQVDIANSHRSDEPSADILRLGFKQSSLCHVTRVSRSGDVGGCSRSPLSQHAELTRPLSASGWLGDPGIISESLPPSAGIPCYLSRRTAR
jgi:hypothetical protein